MVTNDNTKAEILDYVKVLEDTLAEQEDQPDDELERYRGRPAATMPDKIASWLKVSSGRDVDPETVMVQGVTDVSVIYQLKGNKNTFGIPLTSTGGLKDPPIHEHSWVRRGGPGGAQMCLCGKRLSPDGRAMSVEEQRSMAQAESQEAQRLAEAEELTQLAHEIESPEDEELSPEEDADPELNE